MQHLEWDHLRFILAVRRAGSFAGAARILRVDDTTVARRLAALDAAIGQNLLRRTPDGRPVLTPLGEAAADHAERMEAELAGLAERTNRKSDLAGGTVRLTAVPILVNRLLAPSLGPILAAQPGLEIELIPESRNLNLTRRDADLAIRLARPEGGGHRLWTQRIGHLRYGAFAALGVGPDATLITYADDMAHLPQARWLEAVVRATPERRSGLRVTDAETALEAAAAGLGIAVLPISVAALDRRLVPYPLAGEPPRREVWLIGHADQRRMVRIRAVLDWIATLAF
jgi:DNA-binding transcriptional LysR family regulator